MLFRSIVRVVPTIVRIVRSVLGRWSVIRVRGSENIVTSRISIVELSRNSVSRTATFVWCFLFRGIVRDNLDRDVFRNLVRNVLQWQWLCNGRLDRW